MIVTDAITAGLGDVVAVRFHRCDVPVWQPNADATSRGQQRSSTVAQVLQQRAQVEHGEAGTGIDQGT